jgi:methylmalonyl-CoA mutase
VENIKPAVPAPVSAAINFAPLSPTRLALPFERLRDRSDEILDRTGRRPRVFLANLGRAPDFTARATFAKSFFESGGIEAVDNEGFSDASALAAAYNVSGAELACLCSSDRIYAEQAADAAKALQIAGAKHIYLAGRVSEMEASLKTAGVDSFIFAGGDALTVLQDAYRRMEQP